jgi:hypothetical protein
MTTNAETLISKNFCIELEGLVSTETSLFLFVAEPDFTCKRFSLFILTQLQLQLGDECL